MPCNMKLSNRSRQKFGDLRERVNERGQGKAAPQRQRRAVSRGCSSTPEVCSKESTFNKAAGKLQVSQVGREILSTKIIQMVTEKIKERLSLAKV